ncbi:MAG: hypothetical protein LBK77_04105 [Spirochaetaceae bacterium]|jgi:hypothetical protein|nr:hypothetical protein [Spirochaetaceae bacterium]
MGRIKSALEIALERTENVKGDKASIGLFEAKQKGKKLANDYIEKASSGSAGSLAEEINKAPKEERDSLKQGALDVLIAQITLPAVPEDLTRLQAVGNALTSLIAGRPFAQYYQQFLAEVNHYLEQAAQFEEAIKRQYAPKLRQKEEELARRLGRQVKIDPFQDPEFIAFYNQNINALKGNYETLAEQVREQAKALAGNS